MGLMLSGEPFEVTVWLNMQPQRCTPQRAPSELEPTFEGRSLPVGSLDRPIYA